MDLRNVLCAINKNATDRKSARINIAYNWDVLGFNDLQWVARNPFECIDWPIKGKYFATSGNIKIFRTQARERLRVFYLWYPLAVLAKYTQYAELNKCSHWLRAMRQSIWPIEMVHFESSLNVWPKDTVGGTSSFVRVV